ncbi:MAG TPA: CDP-alcohol phosphatidyltransferase family protein [Sulfurihydrogenibium sp.]|uniref:CDP-alcohol phosphatidyltransferase family protein n=1 Tax=Sulfurihydrogenibium sp. (strain YO3AOP1) TaxID=436114 RepID=UPI0001725B18|nr:CDP-alcohol phosphatidyltransferase family protein [Sulfurihydrogenibium sp. YO3AOP1]ACD66233.1 CDP-alcohol phosphatidyltransferase [Sulfurihydrogenibium sp. YO3AOP1]HBT99381.1 CDP-alcohol phosphatidyltransferase family protein [Sulfurihydrogenibium sp.]
MNLPNLLTLLRIILVPVFITFLWYNMPLFALITFAIAGLTDAVDGYLARKYNQETQLGKILDPIADKTLLVSAFVFIFNSDLFIKFPFWFILLAISRDIYILAGSFLIYLIKGSLRVRPSFFGKMTTFLQIFTVIYTLISNVFPNLYNHLFYESALIITFIVMVLSLLTYTYDGIKQLNDLENL